MTDRREKPAKSSQADTYNLPVSSACGAEEFRWLNRMVSQLMLTKDPYWCGLLVGFCISHWLHNLQGVRGSSCAALISLIRLLVFSKPLAMFSISCNATSTIICSPISPVQYIVPVKSVGNEDCIWYANHLQHCTLFNLSNTRHRPSSLTLSHHRNAGLVEHLTRGV